MPALAWLDPVLGTGAKLRVLRALARDTHKAFSEAEMARSIGMSRNTVNLAVRALARAQVVVKGQGRAGLVRLNPDSPLAGPLKDLFDSEVRALDALREAARDVLKAEETCILFGSAARGTMTPRSDVDILLVARSHDAAADASVRLGQAFRAVFPARYQMLHYTPSEVRRKWSIPLFDSIRKDGVLLAGRPLEAYH